MQNILITTTAAARDRRRRLPRLQRGDAIALAVLVVLPLAVFGVPALLGHPVMPGDDLTQNYPLRVLAGRQLAGGHLPLFDPYIWSGAPLLGDWNAGAAYPLTALFAVLPPSAAWTLNLAVTYAVAGAGMFCFLRALRLGPAAGFLGALTFAFAGAMPSQVGHLGLVAGMSWLPVQLLAVLRLTGPDGGRRARPGWIAVLAASFGLTILAGEPRAITSAGITVALYAAWQIARAGRGGWRAAGAAAWPVAAGLVLGACLGAVQLLPGLAAIATSQRAAGTYGLFISGSLRPRWLTLLLVPDLLGGSGSFGQPSFFVTYQLAEVTSYVGILPLAAALALLPRLRRGRPVPGWLVWHLIAVGGIVLALGGFSPAGHLLAHVPLLGSQRLQSRNIGITDTALAVLLACWADDPLGALGKRRARLAAALGLAAPAAVLAVAAAAAWRPASLLHWLGATSAQIAKAGSLTASVTPFAVLAAAVIAVIAVVPRLPAQRRTRITAALVVADVVVFSVLAVVAVAPGASGGQDVASPSKAGSVPAGGARPAPVRPIGSLGYPGRYAIYDPDLLGASSLQALGEPDLNVLARTPSAEGYSAIVDGAYAAATGTHRATGDGQDVLSVRAISSGLLGTLGTSVLLTRPAYLVRPAAAAATGTGGRVIAPGRTATWYLGAALPVTAVTLPDGGAAGAAAGGLQIGLTSAAGQTRWFAAAPGQSAGSVAAARFAGPVTAVAVTVRAGAAPATLGPPSVTQAGGQVVTADGVLAGALQPPQWMFAGFDGSYALFADHDAAGPVTLAGLAGGPAPGASARVISQAAGIASAVAVQSPRGVRLTRSAAAIPGWTATWHPAAGPAVRLAVRRSGVVQAVDVPAGRGVVTWAYAAPGLTAGLALSLAAAALAALAAACALWPAVPRAAIVRFRRFRGRNDDRGAAAGLGHPRRVGDLPVADVAAGPGDRRRARRPGVDRG